METERERKKEMGDSDDYKFLQIRDAIAAINQKVNLIGVIIEFGVPKKTKGTGTLSLSLSLIFFFLEFSEELLI
jgi:hypothetical protein